MVSDADVKVILIAVVAKQGFALGDLLLADIGGKSLELDVFIGEPPGV